MIIKVYGSVGVIRRILCDRSCSDHRVLFIPDIRAHKISRCNYPDVHRNIGILALIIILFDGGLNLNIFNALSFQMDLHGRISAGRGHRGNEFCHRYLINEIIFFEFFKHFSSFFCWNILLPRMFSGGQALYQSLFFHFTHCITDVLQ